MKPTAINSAINEGDGHVPMKRSDVGDAYRAAKAYKLKGEPVRRTRRTRIGKEAK